MTAGFVALAQIITEFIFIYVSFVLLNSIPFERFMKRPAYAQLMKVFLAIVMGYVISLFFINFVTQVQALRGIVG
ncbi:DUF1146 domain-containing protein [Periweissella cryptocerci]|uniref:DUF1146 domain-containing protein n=1 Tax=Periweissella cryptocerci TaxID=2506420 RepID=A0A4P6YVB9_9LACO|nr:DUF1146 family protein [Periweissella cryptocerci]QBO36734.1 DUF1146 domain-containing protein [Periweissella cryptocerci]